MDLIQMIQSLIEQGATIQEMEKMLGMSHSTICRELQKEKTSIRELRKMSNGKKTLLLIRDRWKNVTRKELIKELAQCMCCDYSNVWRKFHDRYGKSVTEHLQEANTKRKNQLTDLEFDLLIEEIKFALRKEDQSYTLKELCELTNRSRAYVLAALRKLPNIYGGNGRGGLKKGYFLTYDEAKIAMHDDWCKNWKDSMGY